MATIRQGYLDDFTIKNSKVGIGTSDPTEALEVIGGSRSQDIKVAGIATLTSYEGFQNRNTSYTENVNIAGGESGTLSGEIVVGSGLTMSVGTAATSGQGSIECMKVYDTFNPPCGGTNGRPAAAKPGTIYYNKDFRTIEYWDGNFWRQVDNTTTRGRALKWGGFDAPATTLVIDYIEIATAGDSQDFGTLSATTRMNAAFGNETRGVHGCLYPSNVANIDYVTIASGGTAIDWGADRTSSAQQQGALANSTRGFFAGGASTNVIDFIEIQTTGNCTDFGDLTTARRNTDGFSSPTRGVISAGGEFPHSNHQTTDFITIASKGNATLWGDIIGEVSAVRCFSSTTRGFFAGGYNPGASISRIKYVTTSSLGNAFDFGDLTLARRSGASGSSHTRGVYMSGTTAFPAGQVNIIDYVTMTTAGNAVDFGDTTNKVGHTAGCSDSHGGLGGF